MRLALIVPIVLALAACEPEPVPDLPIPVDPFAGIPVRTVRLADLNKTDGKPVRVYLDEKELKEFMVDVIVERYDPVLHDSLLENSVGYTPIDPTNPRLGGTIDVPCGRMCKGDDFVYSCKCPPVSIDPPAPDSGTHHTLSGCIGLIRNGVFQCQRLEAGCTCTRHAINLPRGRSFFYCTCS